MGRNILVTGGSGRLGNFVCPYLKEQGYNVANFDQVPPKPDSPNAKAGIPFVQGSLIDLGDCMRAIAFAKPDAIVHLAAIPYNCELQPPYEREWNLHLSDGARFSQRLPNEHDTMEINTMGSFYVCDAARRLGVKQIVAASTYFVLGIGFRISGTSFQPTYLPMDEDHPLLPEDTYSLSKVCAEETFKAFTRAYDMRISALRFMGVYFPPTDGTPDNRSTYPVTVPSATPEDKGYLISNTYQYVDARDISIFIKLCLEAKNLSPFEPFYVITDTRYDEPTVEVVKRRWPFLADMAKDIPGSEGLISGKKAEKLLGYKSEYTWRKR
jgi:nucleoside-diphosphate-sugar epimerase